MNTEATPTDDLAQRRGPAARLLGCTLLLGSLLAAVPSPAAAQPAVAERNTRHALVIGIGEYLVAEIPTLHGIRHDMVSARRIAAAMAIPEANVRMLRDHEATADRIRAEITALNARVADGDRVFVYYSGHGTRWSDPSSSTGACTEGLMASDGQVLTNAELGQRLAPLAQRTDKMLVFYDACFSGGVAGAPFRTRSLRMGESAITPKFTYANAPAQCSQPSNFRTRSLALVMQQQQALPQNVVHIAASRPDEVSFDSSTQGGFATVGWRDCLLGQAQDLDGSGAITVDEVTRCAQAKVTAGLAGQPGILGQQMTVAGNASFVPAWMGAAFVAPAPVVVPAVVPVVVPVVTPPPAPVLPPPAPPRVANPAEILAELHQQRDGSRRVVATVRQPQLKIGTDTLQLDITPARDGHLYVALAGSDGKSLYLLYPNDLAQDNRVRAGQRVSLPGPGWEVVAGGPVGTETLLVMVTDAPRDLAALGQEKSGPFMKTLLDADGRARLQWILANGTPAQDCGKAGHASCSDAFGAALLQVEAVK
ncbi:MAG: caspase family protein [Rubrivivax sp.]|nr:caspase family protein [Rubrivivax sp.]